jgi:hypothetical protein
MPSEENPYPKGSARYKLWERRNAERKAKEQEKKSPGSERRRRRARDDDTMDIVDRMQRGQSTDSNQ